MFCMYFTICIISSSWCTPLASLLHLKGQKKMFSVSLKQMICKFSAAVAFLLSFFLNNCFLLCFLICPWLPDASYAFCLPFACISYWSSSCFKRKMFRSFSLSLSSGPLFSSLAPSIQNGGTLAAYDFITSNPDFLQFCERKRLNKKNGKAKEAETRRHTKIIRDYYDAFSEHQMIKNAMFHNAKQINIYEPFTIFAIETSCDDTACAIINSEGKILSNQVISQNDLNAKHRGVKPDEAAERHKSVLRDLAYDTLHSAKMENFDNINVFGITHGPGLSLCLKVAIDFIKNLNQNLLKEKKEEKPLFLINHLEAHALTPLFFFKFFHNNNFYAEEGWKYFSNKNLLIDSSNFTCVNSFNSINSTFSSSLSDFFSLLPYDLLPFTYPFSNESSFTASSTLTTSFPFYEKMHQTEDEFLNIDKKMSMMKCAEKEEKITKKEEVATLIKNLQKKNEAILVVLISGGNTKIFLMYGISKFLVLSKTEDDAIGEALDKIARSLDLNGAAELERRASNARKTVVDFSLKPPIFKHSDLSMSFSGLKSAMQVQINKEMQNNQNVFPKEKINDFAYIFQNAVFSHLLDRVKKCMEIVENFFDLRILAVSGGVSCNSELQRQMIDLAKSRSNKTMQQNEFKNKKIKNLKIIKQKLKLLMNNNSGAMNETEFSFFSSIGSSKGEENQTNHEEIQRKSAKQNKSITEVNEEKEKKEKEERMNKFYLVNKLETPFDTITLEESEIKSLESLLKLQSELKSLTFDEFDELLKERNKLKKNEQQKINAERVHKGIQLMEKNSTQSKVASSRQIEETEGALHTWNVVIPSKRFCTDNAAMIAFNTLIKIFHRRGISDRQYDLNGKEIFVKPRWQLYPNII